MIRPLAFASSLALLTPGSPVAARAADPHVLSVEVSLSPLAHRTLSGAGEQVTVSAAFYGDPSHEGQAHVDEVGQIDLARRELTLPAMGGIARFPLAAIAQQRLRWITGPVRVNVNVYSARRHFRDNVLACDFLDGPIPRPDRMPVALRCGLIREQPKTRVAG